MKILFVGGHPKGYKDAFSKRTLSGKRLRAIIAQLPIEPEYMDVWKNAEEEEKESQDEYILSLIYSKYMDGATIVVLGRKVESFLKTTRMAFDGRLPFDKFWYLPHPASRRIESLHALRSGLFAITQGADRKLPVDVLDGNYD